jgi:hypothetical protein
VTKDEIKDIATRLCGALSELGFEYHFEADNRSARKSAYIFVRRPRYMQIRISDHPSRRKRRHTFDVGPHGVTLDHALREIATWKQASAKPPVGDHVGPTDEALAREACSEVGGDERLAQQLDSDATSTQGVGGCKALGVDR